MTDDHVLEYVRYRDRFTNYDGEKALYNEPAKFLTEEVANRPDDCELGFGG